MEATEHRIAPNRPGDAHVAWAFGQTKAPPRVPVEARELIARMSRENRRVRQ